MLNIIEGFMKRLEYIDVAKFIGVFLVCFAHGLITNNLVCKLIYSFHIPLFFVLNGYTLKIKDGETYKDFLIKKLKSYILQAFILGLIIILINTLFKVYYFHETIDKYYYLKQVILLLEGKKFYSIWFIFALFCADQIFYLCYYLSRKNNLLTFLFVLAFVGLGIYVNKHVNVNIVWNLEASLFGVLWVYIGFFFASNRCLKIRSILFKNRLIALLFSLVFFAIGFSLAKYNIDHYNSNLEMFFRSYNKPFFVLTSACFSSIGTILFSYSISNKVMALMGKANIIIFSLHQQLPFVIFREILFHKEYLKIVNEFNVTHNENSFNIYAYAFLISIFSIAMLLAVYYIIINTPLAFIVLKKQPKYMIKLKNKIKLLFAQHYAQYVKSHYLKNEEYYYLEKQKIIVVLKNEEVIGIFKIIKQNTCIKIFYLKEEGIVYLNRIAKSIKTDNKIYLQVYKKDIKILSNSSSIKEELVSDSVSLNNKREFYFD